MVVHVDLLQQKIKKWLSKNKMATKTKNHLNKKVGAPDFAW
jgi:hypothetical protein